MKTTLFTFLLAILLNVGFAQTRDSIDDPCTGFYGEVYVTNATNGNNGAVDLTVYGGAEPFFFNWSNDAHTEDIENLAVGQYTVDVEDSLGCSFTISTYVYGEDLDSSETEPVDTIDAEEAVDTCFSTSPTYAEINSYVITADSIITTWLLFDIDNNFLGSVTVYYVFDNDSAGIYQFEMYINCSNKRGTTTFSYPLYINKKDLVTGITSLKNQSETVLTLYPNPVKNTASVIVDATHSSTIQLEVVSITGQVLSSQIVSMNTGKNVVKLNTTSLKTGIYFVRVTDGKKITVKRFVK